ncbi:MAG: leucine-rich repeat domain-containing protein [Fusobacteriota bacterium]
MIEKIELTETVINKSEFTFEYIEDQTKVKITDYDGNSKNLIIPSKLKNTDVFSISPNAFRDKEIKSLIISEGIIDITDTFKNCELEKVLLPNSLKAIPRSAFEQNKLKEIIIPKSITEIGWYAFQENRLESVLISSDVREIGWYAFQDNNIKEINFSNSLEYIGRQAFLKNKLEKIIIPKSVVEIGKNAFLDNNLKEVKILNPDIKIGEGAFWANADNIKILGIKNSTVEDWAKKNGMIFEAI